MHAGRQEFAAKVLQEIESTEIQQRKNLNKWKTVIYLKNKNITTIYDTRCLCKANAIHLGFTCNLTPLYIIRLVTQKMA